MIFKNAVPERLAPEPEKNDLILQILALLVLLCHQIFARAGKITLTRREIWNDHLKIEKR